MVHTNLDMALSECEYRSLIHIIFFRKRIHMEDEIRTENLNERYLFHGTAEENIELICSDGFDIRVQTRNGNAFGKGM